jgi:hypothetical protein
LLRLGNDSNQQNSADERNPACSVLQARDRHL